MNIGPAIKRQLLIFILYLFFCSLFLLNHKGGADIIFMMLMVVAICIHLLVTIIKISRAQNEVNSSWTLTDLVVLLVILVLYFLLLPHYMRFMWWLTN